MKDFTAVMFSFCESVISNSKQETVKKSEAGSSRNYRANLFNNISARIFLWGFYAIFSGLFKLLEGRILSIRKAFRDLIKEHNYLSSVLSSRVCFIADKVSIASRSLIAILVVLINLNSHVVEAQCTGCTVSAPTNGTSYTLSGNQKLCVTGNVGSMSLNFSGTGNSICVATGVTWTQNSGNFAGVTIDVYGTFNMNGSYNFNSPVVINIKPGGVLNTDATSFGNNITINNEATVNFTTTSQVTAQGTFVFNNVGTASVVNALSNTLFYLGSGSTFTNDGTVSFASVENSDALLFRNTATGVITIDGTLYNHGNIINYGLIQTVCGPFGQVGCSFIVGNKGAGKEFNIASGGCVKIGGDATFDGPGIINGGFEVGGNLTINKPVTGTNGSVLVKNGISTINIDGSFNGTGMLFYDVNTASHNFDVKNGNAASTLYTVSSAAGCGSITSPPLASCTNLGGTVFRDFNLNGKRDNADEIGLAGVTVKAFNTANTLVGTTTTLADGSFAINGFSGPLRVEFSNLPAGYVSGPDGTTSSTSIQFVSANSCSVNFGVNHPDDFCVKAGVQPKVAVPCYANGAYFTTGTSGAGLEDALVSFPYNRTGDKATSGNEPYVMSKYSSIGSVWGVAYNKYKKTLFTTAFMKRHSGFGPEGPAGLYVIQNADNNGTGYTITGIDLKAVLGINAGFDLPRNFPINKTQAVDDGGNAVFNAVGKMSFGDCELSSDGNTLYITNLFDKKIYVLNVSNPTSPTLIGSFAVPNPACSGTNEYVPFGLKWYRGKVYVGVICTAESSQPATVGSLYGQAGFDTKGLSSANLKATVYEFNGSTFTTALTQFPLNFDRGLANSSTVSYSIWRPWVNTYSQVNSNRGQTYPQPILSDIEFDSDGSMILGFADRFSHQMGNANNPPADGLEKVVNGDFTAGGTGFSSDYAANNTSNGGGGITTNAQSFYGWASACTDRTSGTGNFIVADGATVAGKRVWYQTISVTPGTAYNLSFWATSINSGTPAKLYFTANGTRIGTDNCNLSSSPCDWVQYSTTWTAPSFTYSITLAIVDGELAATSNDFGLDEISFIPTSGTLETGRVEGDLMRATKSGSTWTIENNGTASGTTTSGANKGGGPGGGEYYFGDITIDHDEPTMGGIALYPGTGETITTAAGPGNIFYSGGTRRIDNSTGDYLYDNSPIAWNNVSNYRTNYSSRPTPTGDYKLYNGDTPGTFGKASGLGDIEVFCALAPLEIGNRIWRDYDQDGIQDANEPGIPSITVLLFKSGVQVASTTTNSIGEYYFNDANVTGGLLPSTAYEIRVATGQTSLAQTFLSPANANTNNSDEIDSDATISGSNAIISVTTGAYGESNHTYDIGFSPNCPTLSNPQPNNGTQTICSGANIPSLTLTSNSASQPLPVTTYIEWCAYKVPQANPYLMVDEHYCLQPEAVLVDGAVTASNLTGLPTNTGTTPITYYVYACLKPVPDANNPYCRPFVAYTIIVNPIPAAPSVVTGGSACKSGTTATVSLGATCGTSETPVWYASQTSTAVLGIGDLFTTPAISATTTYYVGCKGVTSPNCETAINTRKPVVATIITTPAAPTVTITSNGGNGNVCGTSATLESGCTTGTLKWSNNATTNVITVTTSGTYTATCTLNGCTGPVSNSATITINSVPSALTVTGGGVSICAGSSTTLTASACSGTYTWSNAVSGTTATSITVAPTATTNYTVTCTVNGCTSPASANATITVNAIPSQPTVTGGGVTICAGASATLTASGCTGTYTWSNDATTASITVTPTVTTDYTVTCKVNNCTSANSANARVNVSPNPTVTGTGATVCEGETINLSSVGAPGNFVSGLNISGLSFDHAGIPTANLANQYDGGTSPHNSVATIIDLNIPSKGLTDYTSFCAEVGSPISINVNYTGYNIVPLESLAKQYAGVAGHASVLIPTGGIGAVHAGMLRYLYDKHFISTSPSAWTLEQAAAFQIAQWEITHDQYVANPDFSVKNASTNGLYYNYGSNTVAVQAIIDLAETWLNEIDSQTRDWTKYTSTTWYPSGIQSLNGQQDLVVAEPISTCLTYSWTGPNGFTSTAQSPVIANATTANNGVYTVKVTNCNGCTGTATVLVTVNTTLPAPTNATSSKPSVCINETYTLSASCGTNQTVKWYDASGNSITTLTYTQTVSGTYIYKVGCTNSSGCETLAANRATVSVTVNPIPTSPTNPTSSKAAICAGETVTLSGTCGTNQVAQWYEGTTSLGSGNITLTPTVGSHTYSVGCKNTVTGCETGSSNRANVPVVVNSIPNTLTVTGGGVSICNGASATLTASACTGAYLWSNGGTSSSITVSPNVTTNYTVTCT
ncbi:SdrD B-like protein, partial [Arcicella aurantiaca]